MANTTDTQRTPCEVFSRSMGYIRLLKKSYNLV